MAVISDDQIARNAGFCAFPGGGNEQKVAMAVAIALAESGGNTTAHNATPPDNSYGLWQINMYGRLGPDRRAKLGISSNDELFNPCTNAKAMDMISSGGTNWGPWSVYRSGAYKQYLPRAEKVAGGVHGSVTEDPLGVISDVVTDPMALIASALAPLKTLVEMVRAAAEWVGDPANWLRILQVSGGIVLAIVAGNIVLKPYVEKPIKEASKLAGSVKGAKGK